MDVNQGFNKRFREVGIAEFFRKNLQMLGYSGAIRSFTTIIHELTTNGLDACEEYGILPEIRIKIKDVGGSKKNKNTAKIDKLQEKLGIAEKAGKMGQIEKIVDGGVMVCGDAAGQVIPLTGGGIHSSIVAGKVAGEVAAEFLGGKTKSLEEYPKRYTYWTKRIRDSLKALKVIEKLTDRELNQLADVLSGTDVVDLASGIDVRRVALKLLKHPYFALRIAKSLLGE